MVFFFLYQTTDHVLHHKAIYFLLHMLISSAGTNKKKKKLKTHTKCIKSHKIVFISEVRTSQKVTRGLGLLAHADFHLQKNNKQNTLVYAVDLKTKKKIIFLYNSSLRFQTVINDCSAALIEGVRKCLRRSSAALEHPKS